MKNNPDPGETVGDQVGPATEDLVATLAERVGPLAQQAVEALAPYAQQAVEAVTPLAHQVSEALSPYAHQAAETLSPYAHQAAETLSPYAQQAADAVTPLAQQAAEAVAPYAALVREQGLRSGHELADRLEPALEAAKEAFSGARDKVTSDYVPAVGAAAATAAASAAASAGPLVASATDRGRSLVKSVRREPVPVLPPPKKKRGWLTTLAVVAAAAGATYVVVRKVVGDKGSQWQTARPTTPYAPPVSPVSAEAGVAEPQPDASVPGTGETEVVASTTSLYGTVGSAGETGPVDDTDGDAIAANTAKVDAVASADEATDAPPVATGTEANSDGSGSSTSSTSSTGSTGSTPAGSGGAGGSDASTGSSGGTFGGAGASTPFTDKDVETEAAAAEERVYEEPESAVWAEDDAAMGGGPDAHPERYDMAGVYVGVEPPTGYTIKGNERSMKYHLPDSNAYGRTIAQVWFASEEAAQQAGFSRAEH